MITMWRRRALGRLQVWMAAETEAAAEYGAISGLHGTPDEYPAIAEAKLRTKATEIFRRPSLEPEHYRLREARIEDRLESLRTHSRAGEIWGDTVRSAARLFDGRWGFLPLALSVALLLAMAVWLVVEAILLARSRTPPTATVPVIVAPARSP